MDFSVKEGKELTITSHDICEVKEAFKTKYLGRITCLKEEALSQAVTCDSEEKDAVEKVGQVKKLLRDIEKGRKDAIKEQDEFVRGVNSFCKTFKDSLGEIERIKKTKISDYGWQKELERRKKEKEAQEEARKLQGKIDAEAEKIGVEPPQIEAPAPVIKKENVVRTESGTSAHLRTEWKMTEIIDFSLVPDEYKELNESKARAAIKAGIREIPGLKIEECAVSVIRN